MTSDIRAVVRCDLGAIISGSVSDSYVQNAGLIYTKGTLVLQGSAYVPVGRPVQLIIQLPVVVNTQSRVNCLCLVLLQMLIQIKSLYPLVVA